MKNDKKVVVKVKDKEMTCGAFNK
ncbi:methanobactin-like peptide MovA [Vibrio caribbeanicus]|nr:Chain E, MbnA [Vibrio caribbeanicus ATCC BAA-2122]